MMKKWNRKSKILKIPFICVILLVYVSLFARLREVNMTYAEYNEIMFSTFSTYGYSIENGAYTNEVGDAQIQLPEINTYANNVAVIFSEPLSQPINIRVYYAAEDHGYSEDFAVSVDAASGSEKAILLINENVTTCRVDIGTQIGETFSLERIVLNDTSAKATEILTTVLWHVALFIGMIFLFILFSLLIPVESTENGYHVFLAIILSICTVLMTRMQFAGGVWGTINENYFTPFGISAVILFFFCIPVFYLMILLADYGFHKCLLKIYPEETAENTKKVLIFWGIMIVVTWLPYYLSYYPGGIYADTFGSISYSLNGVLTNRHPFLYNVLIGAAIKCGQAVGKDLNWSMGLFLAMQMILLEAEFIYFLYWMLAKKINRAVRIAIMLFLTFFPLIPLYGISVWKDTPFCMAVLLWSIFMVDLYLNIQKNEWDSCALVRFIVAIFLVAFTRNNGIYVVAFSTFVFVIATFKKVFIRKNTIYCVMLSAIAAIIFIQGPVYQWVGISQTETVENFGIPLQQIGSVVAYDGNITEDQKECIDRFLPYENIKDHYSPGLVDNLKWYAGLDGAYLSEHKKEFLELWVQLLAQNPKIYIKAYLLATAGFWNVDVATADAYVQNIVWPNGSGVHQTDYFEKWFGFSFQHFVNPRNYMSCAWFFWMFFICMIFVMKHFGWRKCYLFTPQIGIWLTLMVATPVASSLRYIAALLFTLPFVIIFPILLKRENALDGEIP